MITALFALLGTVAILLSRPKQEPLAPVYDLDTFRSNAKRKPIALKKAA